MADIPPPNAPATAPSPVAPPAAPANDVNIPDLMKRLMQDVTEEESSGDPTKKKAPDEQPKPAAAATAPAAAPAAPKPGEAAPGGEPAIRVRRPKKERPPLPTVDDAPPAPPITAAPVRPAPVDTEAAKKWESELEENEREMLSDAKYLEEKWPDRYKGMSGKVEKFLRDHIAWTEKPDFDEQDPEYRRFLESAPKLTRSQVREIEETRIADKLRKENDTRFNDLQFQTFSKEKETELDNVGRQVYAEMANTQLPDELSSVLKDAIGKHGPQKGYEEALKTHKMEIETAEAVLSAAAEDIKEFNRLSTRDPKTGRMLSEPAKDGSHPKFQQHERLASMVDGICDEFKNSAGEEAIRNGKWFVTRQEWLRLRPETRGRFWTFTNAEIIKRAQAGVKGVIAAAIDQKHRYLKERGWSRAAASAAAPAPAPATSSRRPPPAPAPVPPGGGAAPGGPSAAAKELASALTRD